MADKIIIDGIDVSECRAYMPELGRDNCIALAHNGGSECEKSLVCYYKQLKRKEQECEYMKQQRDYWIKVTEKYSQALDEIEKYLDAQQQYFDGEDYHNLLDIINKAKEQ